VRSSQEGNEVRELQHQDLDGIAAGADWNGNGVDDADGDNVETVGRLALRQRRAAMSSPVTWAAGLNRSVNAIPVSIAHPGLEFNQFRSWTVADPGAHS
jgi:hypothetical protein